MLAVIRQSPVFQISFRFFFAVVALTIFPVLIYFLRVITVSTPLAPVFQFNSPLFYLSNFVEFPCSCLVFYAAIGLDLAGRKWSATLGLISGILVCMFVNGVFCAAYPSTSDVYLKNRFISKRWKEYDGRGFHEEVRLDMVSDLLSRHKLEGMTREQVVDLVGAPESTSWLNQDFEYELGSGWQQYCHDYQTIVLEFKNGKVSNVMWTHHM